VIQPLAEWPALFHPLREQLASTTERVIVAERWTRQLTGSHCHRQLTTGLASPHWYATIAPNDELGIWVSASGPWPRPRADSSYEPKFWIHGGQSLPGGLEALVPAWEANNQMVLMPDLRLLMTYGLIPRVIPTTGAIHWDGPAEPRRDIAVCDPLVARWDFPDESPASVSMLRDYLQDYSSLRGKTAVAVFWEKHVMSDDEPELVALLGTENDVEMAAPRARVRVLRRSDGKLHVEISGYAAIVQPGPLPISVESNQYGSLKWPGIEGDVTESRAQGMLHDGWVFVRDTVLAAYEGFPEYQIHPTSGGVSYGGQWSVPDTVRMGRDLIRLDLRTLYNSVSPKVVRHWHQHAVEPPRGAVGDLRQVPNVGSRAKALVSALLDLGDSLSAVCSDLAKSPVEASKLIRLDRPTLTRRGWWTSADIEAICRHIPAVVSNDWLLARAKALYRAVGEGFSERELRRALSAMGVPSEIMKDLRSLKLLDLLTRLAEVAVANGLRLCSDGPEIYARLEEATPSHPLTVLFALNDLRQLDAHNSDDSTKNRLEAALLRFGVDPATLPSAGGAACDRMYDALTGCLSRVAMVLNNTRAGS
jgi:hypothetical protein